jgi:hypothetical protein
MASRVFALEVVIGLSHVLLSDGGFTNETGKMDIRSLSVHVVDGTVA